MGKVCRQAGGCRKEEFGEVLKELDRRYFIVQGAQWEFQLLDPEGLKSITQEDGLFLFKAVHKERFMMKSWQAFLAGRLLSGTRITWAEIEVPLCDIPEWAEARAQREAEFKRGGWGFIAVLCIIVTTLFSNSKPNSKTAARVNGLIQEVTTFKKDFISHLFISSNAVSFTLQTCKDKVTVCIHVHVVQVAENLLLKTRSP